MAKDINLLPDITLQEEKQEKIRKLLTLISMSILVIGMVATVIVFAIQITMDKQLTTINNTNTDLVTDILSFSALELDQRDLVSKLEAIKFIRDASKNYKIVLQTLEDNSPPGVSPTNITITQDDIMTFTGTVNSTTTLHEFIERLLTVQKSEKPFFNDIAISSLTRSETGEYQFAISCRVITKNRSKE